MCCDASAWIVVCAVVFGFAVGAAFGFDKRKPT